VALAGYSGTPLVKQLGVSFGGRDAVSAAELPVMLAYGEALAGTGKPLVVTFDKDAKISSLRTYFGPSNVVTL
jgi:hypothetical protein